MITNRILGRSAVTAAALIATTVASGGCSPTGPGTSAPSTSASGTSAPGTSSAAVSSAPAPGAADGGSATGNSGSATGNSADVCAQIDKAKANVVSAIAKGAASSGGAGAAYKKALAGLARVLNTQAARATEKPLAAALRQAAAATAKVAAAADPLNADQDPFEKAGDQLDRLCAAAKPAAGPVKAGATVGGAGSACQLPVTFAVVRSWRPKAVTVDANDVLGDLVKKGPLTVACEIDGKPAGTIGFLRVWTGAGATGTPRATLATYLTGEKPLKPRYVDSTLGGRPAVEVTYQVYDKLLEEKRTRRAFALQTSHGAVVVALGGLDDDKGTALLPAYDLAKQTLTVNS